MNRINIYILFFLIAVTTVSCDRDELLDVKPYGSDIPTSVEDFRLLLDNRFGPRTSSYSQGTSSMYDIDLYMSDDVKFVDDPTQYLGSSGAARFFNALTWEEHFCNIEEKDSDWSALYNMIYICNMVIESMNDAAISGNADEKLQLEAEAKVHRANAYWALVNLYAVQYNAATASQDMGVPVLLSSEPGQDLARASVQAVYDQILKDLNDALTSSSLPEVPEINIRASEAGAYGVLAKIHLSMDNITQAESAATECLSRYNFLYDYSVLSTMPLNYNNEELIMLKSPLGEGQSATNSKSNVYLSDDLVALYHDADSRLGLKYKLDWGTGSYVFNLETSTYRGGLRFYMGPSVAEMYLLRAEAYVRNNNISDAMADIETIRLNRIDPTHTAFNPLEDHDNDPATPEVPVFNQALYDAETKYSPTTNEEALAIVKTERRIELAGQGVRLFDLKRYNVVDNANISITRTVPGVDGEPGRTVVLEANSPRWLVPIARDLRELNPELEQNPR